MRGALDIVRDYLAAVEHQREAEERRLEYLYELVDTLPGKSEGTTTTMVTDVVQPDAYSVAITRKFNRTIDVGEVDKLHNMIDIERFFKKKYELRVSEWRKADEMETLALSRVITTRQGRPSVQIKKVEE